MPIDPINDFFIFKMFGIDLSNLFLCQFLFSNLLDFKDVIIKGFLLDIFILFPELFVSLGLFLQFFLIMRNGLQQILSQFFIGKELAGNESRIAD